MRLSEAYRGLLLTGRYPIAFLRIEMPPDLVDVNVHPTKLEVRFQEAGRLYSQLLGTLRTKFLTTDLTARLRAGPLIPTPPRPSIRQRAEQMRRELVDWAKGQLAAAGAGPFADVSSVGPVAQTALRRAARRTRRWSSARSSAAGSRSAGYRTTKPSPTRCRSNIASTRPLPMVSAARSRRPRHCRFTTAIWSPRATTAWW